MYMLKHHCEWHTEIQYDGWDLVGNIALGKAKACILHHEQTVCNLTDLLFYDGGVAVAVVVDPNECVWLNM